MSIYILGLSFHLYGLILGFAIVTSLSIVEYVLKKEKINMDVSSASIFVIIFGIIGARIYHLVTDWHLYADKPWIEWFEIWNGGLGVIGALMGGGLALLFYLKQVNKEGLLLAVLDALALSIPLGQAIGRWGNYVNQELYGVPTDLPWAIRIDAVPGVRFHPLFLYESLLMVLFAGVIGVLYVRKQKVVNFGSGTLFLIYLIYYGVVRFILEFLRIDSARISGGFSILSTAQWVTVVIITMSIGALMLRRIYYDV